MKNFVEFAKTKKYVKDLPFYLLILILSSYVVAFGLKLIFGVECFDFLENMYVIEKINKIPGFIWKGINVFVLFVNYLFLSSICAKEYNIKKVIKKIIIFLPLIIIMQFMNQDLYFIFSTLLTVVFALTVKFNFFTFARTAAFLSFNYLYQLFIYYIKFNIFEFTTDLGLAGNIYLTYVLSCDLIILYIIVYFVGKRGEEYANNNVIWRPIQSSHENDGYVEEWKNKYQTMSMAQKFIFWALTFSTQFTQLFTVGIAYMLTLGFYEFWFAFITFIISKNFNDVVYHAETFSKCTLMSTMIFIVMGKLSLPFYVSVLIPVIIAWCTPILMKTILEYNNYIMEVCGGCRRD